LRRFSRRISIRWRAPWGGKHRASEWLEDGGETEYYLDTDGSFYTYEHGAPVYVAQLTQEDVQRLSGK
jgi:hypothetical protein